MIRKLFITLTAVLPLAAGEYHSIIIRDTPCCECNCEYNPEIDILRYGEDLKYKYTYFGGVPHVCVHDCVRDEKGIDLSKKHTPHICYGEWCPKECCFSLEDYFILKWGKEELLPGGDVPHPVIPTPPPVSSMN